jgi:hypothetical protein
VILALISLIGCLPGIASSGVELEFVCNSMGFVIEPFGFGAFDEVP